MYTIRKKFKMELAHQLIGAYTKECCNLHGHSYICEVYFKSDVLDKTGMVVDFTKVKDTIKAYMDTWDHALIMSKDMPQEYLETLKKFNKNLKIVDYNPTAENMAKDIYNFIRIRMSADARCTKVRLHETDTGYAEYSGE